MSPNDPTTTRPPNRKRGGRPRRRSIAAVIAILGAVGATGVMPSTADAAPAVTITVDAGTSLGTVPDAGIGLNTAVYDGYLGNAAATSLMKAAGIRQLRYPGGSVADGYHWKTHTITGGGSWAAPNTDFDHFMSVANAVGAAPIIIANYGSGTPQEAADWVKYANVDKHYGAKYWEIGNEVYGNGHYGSGWEGDTHADKSPTTYATNLVAYAKAMKAVDPTVKIGAVLTTPGGWPDGQKAAGDGADWNHTVLSIAAGSIDFVIVHSYPGGNTSADLLNQPGKYADVTATLRSLIATYTGSRASSVQIAVTETDGDNSPSHDTQASALFASDTYMTWFEHGVFNVDWWDLHNGPGKIATVDGETDYQDEGVLAVGSCVSGTCEPAVDTPFPTYWGIRALTALAAPGDTMVKSSSGSASVAVHAVRTRGGGLNVMMINKDPANAAPVALSYTGFTPAPGAVTTVSFAKGGTALKTATAGTAAAQTLPPYSITTIQLKPVGAKSAPSTPASSSTTSAAAVVAPATTLKSFPAAGTSGARPAHQGAPGSMTPPAGSQSGSTSPAAATTKLSATDAAADARSHGGTGGALAFTGAGSVVTYGMIGSLAAIGAGSVLVLRRRNAKVASHRR